MISILSTLVLQIALLFALLSFPSHVLADKCGTFGNRFHARQEALRKGESLLAPDLPFSFVSSNKHFKIHYSKLGEGAVDQTDNNKNTVPDYVEECARAFEYAYAIEVDSMGFPPPPNNGENGTAPYDVYIIEFADQGYYGLTTVIESLPNSTSRHSYSRTYIEVDNNYSISDKNGFGNQSFNTFGLDALKITAAHEFHHAIQLANYGMNDQQYDVSFYEMFSTWLEFHIYPDIKDYHFYVRNYFLEPKLNRFGQRYVQEIGSGYANALFLEYVHAKVGYDPMLQTWQEIGRKTYAYHALEMALQNNSTPLHQLWCGYQERVFLTGKRAVNKDSHEIFRDARVFPELKGKIDSADPIGMLTGSIFPYEFSLNSCILSGFGEIADTAHILISTAYQDYFRNIGSQDIAYSVIVNNDGSKTPIGLSDYYADINTNSIPNCSLIRLAGGKYLLSASRVYPNPLILSTHKSINLPVPSMLIPGDIVEVKIFTPSGMPVISKQVPVSIDYDNSSTSFTMLMAKLEEIQGFEPGVYIFTVNKEGNPETATGIFIVKP
ncbi:MAG: MXAN_6640 family putative metalloprotease [Candidatus Kapaibacteriota bacterium]